MRGSSNAVVPGAAPVGNLICGRFFRTVTERLEGADREGFEGSLASLLAIAAPPRTLPRTLRFALDETNGFLSFGLAFEGKLYVYRAVLVESEDGSSVRLQITVLLPNGQAALAFEMLPFADNKKVVVAGNAPPGTIRDFLFTHAVELPMGTQDVSFQLRQMRKLDLDEKPYWSTVISVMKAKPLVPNAKTATKTLKKSRPERRRKRLDYEGICFALVAGHHDSIRSFYAPLPFNRRLCFCDGPSSRKILRGFFQIGGRFSFSGSDERRARGSRETSARRRA